MLFERLYQEKYFRENDHVRREQMKLAKETIGCSFTPQRITKKSFMNSSLDNLRASGNKEMFDRLYQDHEIIQKNKQMQKLVIENKEKVELTFVPKLLTSKGSHQTISSMEQQRRFESLYQDSSRRRDKIQKIKEDEVKNAKNLQLSQRKRSNSVASNSQKENSQPRYVSLYENSIQKKDRMRKLEKDVYQERGITFTPTKYSTPRSLSMSRSQTNATPNKQASFNLKASKGGIHENKTKQAKNKLPPKPLNNNRK